MGRRVTTNNNERSVRHVCLLWSGLARILWRPPGLTCRYGILNVRRNQNIAKRTFLGTAFGSNGSRPATTFRPDRMTAHTIRSRTVASSTSPRPCAIISDCRSRREREWGREPARAGRSAGGKGAPRGYVAHRPRARGRQVPARGRGQVLGQGSDLRALRPARRWPLPPGARPDGERSGPDPGARGQHDPRLSPSHSRGPRPRARTRPQGFRGRAVVQTPLLHGEPGGPGERSQGGACVGPCGPRASRRARLQRRQRAASRRGALGGPCRRRAFRRRARGHREAGGPGSPRHLRELPSHRVPAPAQRGLLHDERVPPLAGQVPGLLEPAAEPLGREAAAAR